MSSFEFDADQVVFNNGDLLNCARWYSSQKGELILNFQEIRIGDRVRIKNIDETQEESSMSVCQVLYLLSSECNGKCEYIVYKVFNKVIENSQPYSNAILWEEYSSITKDELYIGRAADIVSSRIFTLSLSDSSFVVVQ